MSEGRIPVLAARVETTEKRVSVTHVVTDQGWRHSVNSCLASQRGRGGHLEIFADCVQTHHLAYRHLFLGLSAEKTWKQFTLIETGKPSLQILVSSTVLPGKMVYSRNVPGASRGARKKASAQANTHKKQYVDGLC